MSMSLLQFISSYSRIFSSLFASVWMYFIENFTGEWIKRQQYHCDFEVHPFYSYREWNIQFRWSDLLFLFFVDNFSRDREIAWHTSLISFYDNHKKKNTKYLPKKRSFIKCIILFSFSLSRTTDIEWWALWKIKFVNQFEQQKKLHRKFVWNGMWRRVIIEGLSLISIA